MWDAPSRAALRLPATITFSSCPPGSTNRACPNFVVGEPVWYKPARFRFHFAPVQVSPVENA
jgi:hypothetical protein